MRNPYEVLEIKEGSSLEEVTKAYREMVKKYHPDQYGNNPLKDLAEEKLREVNEAYDTIKKQFSSNRTGNYSSSNSSYSSSNSNDNGFYNEVRMDIQRGNIEIALNKLSQHQSENAEWYFLMGAAHMQKGWYDSASNYLSQAVNMSPNNLEYRTMYNNIRNRNNQYRQTYSNRNAGGYGGLCGGDFCDTCFKLWALDTCCECMGGDCISCF